MRPTSRIPLLALIVALVVGLASPAGAATSSSRRSSRSADPGAASDADLDHAVQAVNGQVKNEEVRAEAAQQALDAAIAQEQTADAQVAAGAAKVAQMRTAVMDRAVESYIHPEAVDTTSVVKLSDLAEISRRAALFDEVAKRDRETLDQLIATKSDLVANQQIAARARSLADQRRQLEAQTLIELKQAQADRQRLQGVLQARITEYQQEADAVGAEETNLSNLIRSKQAPAAPASRGPDPDAGGNGRTSSSGLIWPVAGPVTSPFGYRWGRLHAGLDIGVGIGTPIHAAKAGTVIFAGQMSGYGNVVIVDHGGGFSTLYAHQSRLAASEGQQVTQGQVIGYSGNTGHSTGPHVHFETRVNGNPQNPRQYLP